MVDSKQQWKAWLYLAPAIVLLLVFTLWPIINTVRMAFLVDYSGLKAAAGQTFSFGLGNFVKVVQYKKFLQCMKNTILLCVLTVPISTIDSAWSDEYENITVTIVVAGLEDYAIQCFRLKGEGAKDLAVGDEITVTGTLKNYEGTVEFDAGCTLN